MSRAPDRPRVSLLLPNRNNGRILDEVLARLSENTTYDKVELVAVDDGSTDDSLPTLRRWRDSGRFSRFELVEKAPTGAVDSLNAALERATGEFCVQLDSDASVETPGWIERMLGLMLLDEAVGVVTAKIVIDDGLLHACGVNLVGPAGSHDRPARPTEPVGHRRWHHRIERVPEGKGGDAEIRLAEVDAGIGCCMMYRREDALAVGGYDRAFSPVWFDDLDLCMSIRKCGRKVFCLPEVRVVHHLNDRRPPESLRERLRARRVGRALVRRASPRLPGRVRNAIERNLGVDLDKRFSPEQLARMDHHYAYWRKKWEWDFCNPDVDAIQRRWGDTEICWATDPQRRAAGERIARTYEAR